MDITILFPVLDERLRLRKGIETTVKYLRKNSTIPYHLMILDNGSTDETPEIAARLCEEYEEVEYAPVKPLEEMTKEEILNTIGAAGVVGMGGAGFPTRVKLSPKEPDKIDYIIANCAECEPYITADYRRMMETPEKLVGGMKIVLKLFDNAKGIFGVEDN